MARASFAGGQDNLPALEKAWDLAATADRGVVLWIHQPQPVLLSPESALRQRIERTAVPVRLFEFQTRNGPDRILEKLDGLAAVEHVPRLRSIRADLDELLATLSGKRPGYQLARERVVSAPEAATGERVGPHLERLWARDEALRLASQRQGEAAAVLAAENQLVTPLTGAVVLETREQFTQHGLKPVDPMTVPAIPEPNILSLVGVGILAWTLRRRSCRGGC